MSGADPIEEDEVNWDALEQFFNLDLAFFSVQIVSYFCLSACLSLLLLLYVFITMNQQLYDLHFRSWYLVQVPGSEVIFGFNMKSVEIPLLFKKKVYCTTTHSFFFLKEKIRIMYLYTDYKKILGFTSGKNLKYKKQKRTQKN